LEIDPDNNQCKLNMSIPTAIGDFLFKNLYPLYKPAYFLFKGWQDSSEIELLERHISNGEVILDIGANIGFYAALLSRLTGHDGMVHCFEPDPLNFSRLEENCRSIGNIRMNRMAVGERTERLTLYTSNRLNVDHRTYRPDSYAKEVSVPSVCIDDYLAENRRLDFIKMDIQGYETQAIKGMQQTIGVNRDVMLLSEFWPYGLQQSGSSATEYFDLLSDMGFIVDLIERTGQTRLTREKVGGMEKLSQKPDRYFNIFAVKGGLKEAGMIG
jgi:FkbM family methyltransferase